MWLKSSKADTLSGSGWHNNSYVKHLERDPIKKKEKLGTHKSPIDPDIRIQNSPALRGLFKGWREIVPRLSFKFGTRSIQDASQVFVLYNRGGCLNREKDIRIFLGNRQNSLEGPYQWRWLMEEQGAPNKFEAEDATNMQRGIQRPNGRPLHIYCCCGEPAKEANRNPDPRHWNMKSDLAERDTTHCKNTYCRRPSWTILRNTKQQITLKDMLSQKEWWQILISLEEVQLLLAPWTTVDGSGPSIQNVNNDSTT